mmetsp:Transcript_52826/g.115388  ORF Transcript_52826/g.115388 Transcript_52826/m.115388 type:complete len:84 (+) Transcript_52826:259-510(+)
MQKSAKGFEVEVVFWGRSPTGNEEHEEDNQEEDEFMDEGCYFRTLVSRGGHAVCFNMIANRDDIVVQNVAYSDQLEAMRDNAF